MGLVWFLGLFILVGGAGGGDRRGWWGRVERGEVGVRKGLVGGR